MLKQTIKDMMNYIKKSINKFKEDAVSKMIYDILKWLIIIILTIIISKLIPEGTTINSIINSKFNITLYQLLLLITVIIILTTIVIYALFRLKYKELQINYYTDDLTKLKNHKALKKYLELKIETLKNNSEIMSIILIDIDDFKKVNEKVGFNTADALLKKVGELLGNDKRATDETFRYFQRGDEFLVVLNETSLEGAINAAERKKKLIGKTSFEVSGKQYNLTVCCGVTEFKKGLDDYKSITERVNVALLEAKKNPSKNFIKSLV